MDIRDEITIPGQEARHGDAPAWLTASPAWPAVRAQTGDSQLYLHQAMGLELVGQGHNLVISTGTASGKSLVFQAPTLHHLATNPNAAAIAIYPIKALARDQVIRWQNMAEAAGLDPASIARIDGDVRDLTERRQILQRTRLALMTPDVIQQWLMAYSEPLYGKRPLRHDLREVQNTQYNVRRFLSNLAILILDEAHTYDGALGTHCLYLLHRLQQKRRELMAQFEPLRVIAASATIHNPAQHLETLTGLPFQVVDDRYNGSPRAELTVQHVVGREPHDEGWRDLQAAVREVISADPDRSYIAFIDDRQLAERAAAGIEAARSITEDAIIVESRDAMAYRSGLMRRERIEEALRAGDIRGLASTSAMEMGIDIPDLQVGFNLGLPHSVGRLKQRAGRVGRTGPGRFIIVAPRHAFQFHEDSLAAYWGQPVEPARLYPSNPNIKNTHGRCLAKETDLNGMERAIPSPTDAWPEQLPQTLREIARGDHYAPEFQTGDPRQPHRNDIRDAADGRASIVQLMPGGEGEPLTTELLTSEVTRREAARDAYPLATYFHAKQSYSVLAWRESGGETVITARHAPPRETRPITQSGATVTLQQPRTSKLGHLEYCTHSQAVAWERIVGCSVRETGDGEWRDVQYSAEGIPEVVTNLRTTATVIIIWEDWFDDANTRRDVARALRTVLCSRESIHPADIRTTHQNIQVVRDGRSSEVRRAIVLWDKVGGGLGLSKAVADNLGRYTQALLEISRASGQRSERERLLREDTAALLHRWAAAVAPHTLHPEQTPAITEYGGVTFRSQLEARWAAYFDRRGITWEYEPARFDGWTPDFRLVLDGMDVYAEVKPVTEFPMDVAQRMLNAGCDGDVLILGNGPRHAWRCRDSGWGSMDLTV